MAMAPRGGHLQPDAPGLVGPGREVARVLVAGALPDGGDGRRAPRHRISLDAREVCIGEELHNARVVGRARARAHAELGLR